jgi:hypothetical protein
MPAKSLPEGTMIVSVSPSLKRLLLAFILMAIAVALGIAAYFWCLSTTINQSTYQAVFLTNGQVYFGKLSNPWSKYIRLSDVYYIQTKDGVQSQDLANAGTGDMALIKLGKEMHGPADKMEINRSQVLFIEDLKDDSKVVQAIKDFKGK